MKNFKLLGFLLALFVVTTTYAQSKQAEEKAALKKEIHNPSVDMHKELKALRAQYKTASVEEKKVITEKIKTLKAQYNKEVKAVKIKNDISQEAQLKVRLDKEEEVRKRTHEALNENAPQGRARHAKAKIVDEEYQMVKNEMLIKNGRQKLEDARIRLAKQKALGEITAEDAVIKEKKIAEVERKLNNHAALIERSKSDLAKQKEALSKLIEK